MLSGKTMRLERHGSDGACFGDGREAKGARQSRGPYRTRPSFDGVTALELAPLGFSSR
jgi:hypothetical protein